MSELWCEYEAKINWLQMYRRSTYVGHDTPEPDALEFSSPATKRRKPDESECDECEIPGPEIAKAISCENCDYEIQEKQKKIFFLDDLILKT